MNIETLQIEARDKYQNTIGKLVITYEYVYGGKQLSEDGYPYHHERARLVRAEMLLSNYGSVTMPITLNDELIDEYEKLITQHTGLEIEQEAAA